ncbi:MAG: hypothetical protein M3069_18080 [Chloroflexota bacterium]|nr:hypothetical protein [Chloroflexota bacterium]
MDTWLLLRDFESNGERNRGPYIMKSRGMAHSKQVREFLLTDRGVELIDVYSGPVGVYMGSARLEQEQRLAATVAAHKQDAERAEREQERARRVLDAKMAVLQAEAEGEQAERIVDKREQHERMSAQSMGRVAIDLQRTVDLPATGNLRDSGRRHVGPCSLALALMGVRLWDAATGISLQTLRADRRYDRLAITGLTGVTEAQRETLLALGGPWSVHDAFDRIVDSYEIAS